VPKIVRIAVRLVCSILLVVAGCSASYHSRELHSERDRQMTLGVVQKEIRRGLSQADVAEALGSPNIVNVSPFGQQTKVRVNVQETIKTWPDNTERTAPVDDPAFYRDFFARVDKGIFIQKEKL